MKRTYDIVAIGESLIDFVQSKNSDTLLFQGNAGGAPLNVLATACRFGAKCACISRVGNDIFGHHLKKTYDLAGIDTDSMIFSNTENTTLAFVSINKDGDREFSFYRNSTADCLITKKEIDLDVIEKTRVFHFGSLSMTTDCAKEATLFAINVAKENGSIISFDPNYRPALWESVDSAIDAIVCGCYLADIIKISDTELFLLSNLNNVIDASWDLLNRYDCSLLIVTMGAQGAICFSKQGLTSSSKALDVKPVDTTGAGDAFLGAFLASLLKINKSLSELNNEELELLLSIGTTCGSLSTLKYGAIPSLPSKEEVYDALPRKPKWFFHNIN